jgi:hypothetical protein
MKLKQLGFLLMLVGSTFALGGCVAGLAANAVGLAARSVRGVPQSNAHLAPVAAQACSARASSHGAVKVIDVEQHSKQNCSLGNGDPGHAAQPV